MEELKIIYSSGTTDLEETYREWRLRDGLNVKILERKYALSVSATGKVMHSVAVFFVRTNTDEI